MKMAMVMIGLMVASLTVIGSSAQQIATCGSKLVACGPYVNSTSPPESCCGPLKDALTHDLACLCSIYKSPNLLKAFGIDLNSALQLPRHCGMPSFSSTSACPNNTAEAPGASINPPPAEVPGASINPPPATPGGNINGAHSLTWLGLPSSVGMFLFWWSILA